MEINRTNGRAIIDHARSAGLSAVGLPNMELAVCVTEDGRADLVLINTTLVDDDRSTYNPTTPDAPHEQQGPLPAEYAHRITARQPHCGRRAKSGALCRTPVVREGDSCFWHGGAR